jgi:HD-GYP domain-containing protein (c-di-GMP phosphodiesterase class II)
MLTPDLRRSTLARIVLAVLFLGTALGGLAYWVETKRVDDTVTRLALQQANNFVSKHLGAATSGLDTPDVEAAVRNFMLDDFPIVDLYDQDQNKKLEVIAKGKENIQTALEGKLHGLPNDKQAANYRIESNGNTYIQVLIPLNTGYFEGIYELNQQTRSEIAQGLRRTTLTVFLAVVATGILLFPLMMRLNREIIRTSKAILAGNIELMEVLGSAIAKRDSDTNTHNYRVTLYAIELAYAVNLPHKAMRSLIAGSFLHDVGKIGIPDAILLKPGKLSYDEYAIMKTHVTLGGDILDKSSWLSAARDIVLNHHEKFAGSGYPKGIKGNEIPLTARIFAVVDVFDALTSKRPYKVPMSLEKSLEILKRDAGSHFDPELVDTFIKIAPALYQRMHEMPGATIEELLRKEAAYYYGIR